MKFYDRSEERTGVQVGDPYRPTVDIQCDFVMVYGIDEKMPERIEAYREKGYIVHLMTGVSWGHYVDFLDGSFDGKEHWDEGQITYKNEEKSHGHLVPYMCPSVAFSNFLTQRIKAAVDAGVVAIHLEEPEFWVESGYSPAFKREWQIYYKEPWVDPISSPDAQFKASKLKSYLYRRTLDRLCCELKEYALSKYGRDVRFYVPTHSLVNYSQWRIVSPESSLIDVPTIDGYIAQIWTGTSRECNVYEGELRERTFETAFLEYGIMQELTRGTGRRMWFLHDPIEDNPRYTWREYRRDYYRTVSASLFHYNVHHFEVSPWPHRVIEGKYPRGEHGKPIPPEYATNLLTVMHTLRDMDWEDCSFDGGNIEVGVFMADSAMFQRLYPENTPEAKLDGETTSVKRFNSFYGLTLPLLKQGLAVKPVQLDNLRRFAAYLDGYHTLVLSYEFMKPEYPDIHNALAQWVKNGGNLIYVGDGSDSFNSITSWWNSGKNSFKNPAEHLFTCLGLDKNPEAGLHRVEKGHLYYLPVHPSKLALYKQNADDYRRVVDEVLALNNIKWKKSASIVLRRGPYVVTAVMDESVTSKAQTLKGAYIDLYDHRLSVVKDPKLEIGSVGLYYDVNKIDTDSEADIIAAAGRVDSLYTSGEKSEFTVIGPEKIVCAVRIYLQRVPKAVKAFCGADEVKASFDYDKTSKTALINFDNSPNGIKVEITY